MKYVTWNGIEDEGKLAELIASMTTDGWIGAPLVADDDQLLTGSHRYVAARAVGIEAPVIDIRELVPNWDDLITESPYSSVIAIEDAINYEIDEDIRNEYGIETR